MRQRKKPAGRPGKFNPSKPTLVVWVLDETGSMDPIRDQTISGFNEFLVQLGNRNGEFLVQLTKFNSIAIEHSAPRPLGAVERLSPETYHPDGMTPLYDALWDALESARTWRDNNQNSGVIVVVQTDGQENYSTRCTLQQVGHAIDALRASGGEIIFLGVGIDLWQKEALARYANIGTMSYDTTMQGPMMASIAVSADAYQKGGSAGLKVSLRETARAFAGTKLSGIGDDDGTDAENEGSAGGVGGGQAPTAGLPGSSTPRKRRGIPRA